MIEREIAWQSTVDCGTTYTIHKPSTGATTSMTILTRDILIDKLRTAFPQEDVGAGSAANGSIAAWAFDQFYAEEAGAVTFEPGYHRVISGILDDLMFSDQPGFALTTGTIEQMISQLEQAVAVPDEVNDDESDDEDDDDDGALQ